MFGFDVGGKNIVATDNYFSSGVQFFQSWQDVTFTGNTVFNESPYRVAQISDSPINGAVPGYTWDHNAYITNAERPFIITGGSATTDQWLTRTGFDTHSTFSDTPRGTFASVLPNEYEPGRGHAVVYNWDQLDSVDLDLSSLVPLGVSYEIYNVLDLKGAPVATGVYTGGTIALPMTDVTSPIPLGHKAVAPLVVQKEFGSFVIVADVPAIPATGNEFFVSTSGTPLGDGSLSHPWDLSTAMSHPEAVLPGDTIWILGGTYTGDFTSILSGTPTHPIHVREWPSDEVIIDLNNGSPSRSEVITIEGQHTIYQGFEVFSSDLSSRTTSIPGSWPEDINRGNINVFGDHVKLVNWEIHDLNKGVGFWGRADGGEIYGSLIYNNGWSGPDREHGHGIYSQNEDFDRRFADNILFNQFRHGIKIYGSNAASLKNYQLERNISFNNGAAGTEGFTGAWQYFVGGGSLAENIIVDNNYAYVSRRPIQELDAGDEVVYTAQQSNGEPLPNWLKFYGDEGYFEGTPSAADIGTIEIELTATDLQGESVTDQFKLTVTPPNLVPTVVAPIEDLTLLRNDPIHLDTSAVFDDPDGDTLSYTLSPQAGGVIPNWIQIDPATGVITGTAVDVGTTILEVTAFDDSGDFVTASFAVKVSDELLVNLFPLNPVEAKLDGSWWSSIVASDGNVYFGSSTHAHDTAARIFQYDRVTETVTPVGPDLSTIVGEDPTVEVPQGKLHGPFVESDGWLYSSTHLANYWPEAIDAYTGAHVFGYRLGSGQEASGPEFVDFGIPQSRFTTYASVAVDPSGQYVWSFGTPWAAEDVSNQTAHLYRTHIATRTIEDFGEVIAGEKGARASFGIHVDDRGDAWLAPQFGGDKLYVARAATQTIESFEHALPSMNDSMTPGQRSAYQDGTWIQWGTSIDGERFLFTMADDQAPFADRSGGSLWEFDASKAIDGDLSDAFREIAWIGASNLAVTHSDDTVYFVRRNDGGNNAKIDGSDDNGETWNPTLDTGVRLHLYSVNINDPEGVVTDWGMITDADGRIPWRIHSVSADAAAGEVYISGDWIMNESDPVNWRTLRHAGDTSAIYTRLIRGQAFAVAKLPAIADLKVTVSDHTTTVLPEETLTYTIEVTNKGPSAANDATLSNTFPPEWLDVMWTAVGSDGATGYSPAGTGAILDTGLQLPFGATITYTVHATVADDTPHAKRFINTASVFDINATDIDTSNNFATDNDTIVVDADSRLVAPAHRLNPYQATLDGQTQGSFFASDGKVYFASSTHAHDEAARLFQYDPATDALTVFPQNLSEILGEDVTTQVPQGAIRSIAESNGWLYLSSQLANEANEAETLYTGSHLFGYQLGTLETGSPVFRDFGILKNRYSNDSAVDISPDDQYVWTIATPVADDDIETGGTYAYRTSIASGVSEEFGPLATAVMAPQTALGFHVDARGDAWITASLADNQLYVVRHDTGVLETFADVLPLMTDSQTPDQPGTNQDGRWWHWNHQIDSERLLFTMYADPTVAPQHQSGGSIWEFDTSKIVGNDFSNAFRQVAWIGPHTSAMTYSDGTVFFVRRNDGVSQTQIDALADGIFWDTYSDEGVRLHLYSIDINDPSGTVVDQGMISDNEGRVPWRIESMSANLRAGQVYLTADLVMNENDPDQWKSLRHRGTSENLYQQRIHGQVFMVAPITVPHGANLEIEASDSIDPVTIGDQVTYHYTITNHGLDPATNVVVTNPLPESTTFVSASTPHDETDSVITFNLGDLGMGESTELSITLLTSQIGTLHNTIQVSSDTEESITANNTITATTTVNPVLADLELTVTDALDPLVIGDDIAYQWTLTNHGPRTASNVVIAGSISLAANFVSSSLEFDIEDGSFVTRFDEVTVGQSVVIDLVVTPTQIGEMILSASVSSDTLDPNPSNNAGSESTIVEPLKADLQLIVTDDLDPVLEGDQVVYSVMLTNQGPHAATDTILSSPLPSNVTFVSSTASCSLENNVIRCDLGDLSSGQSEPVSIVVASTLPGEISNVFSVTSSTLDPDPTNNTATVTTQVDPILADLTVELADDKNRVALGQEITYHAKVTNHGPHLAQNVSYTQVLPAGISFVSATTLISNASGTLTGDLGDLPAGEFVEFDIVVTSTASGQMPSTATVHSDTRDPDATNNSVSELTLVAGPPGSTDVVFVSFSDSGRVDNIPYDDEDILAFDSTTQQWSLYFDGSQVGLAGGDIDAFYIHDDGSLLLSFDANMNVSGLGLVRDSDIVKFHPTSHGVLTAGSFEWFFDGSDVGLSPTSGDVDSISFTPDGRLLVSLLGNYLLPGLPLSGDDLLVLNQGVYGIDTSGEWAMYLDGSELGLEGNNVQGVSVDHATGEIHVTTADTVSSGNTQGSSSDVLTFLESISSESFYTLNQRFDGSAHRVTDGQSFDGLQIGKFAGNEVFGSEVIYMSPASNLNAGGFYVADEDIVYHDTRTGAWRLLFDGSDVG
ncbi:putative Ig domain-containing protein, partial [Novipirellula rosea]|uniref:putative Ig domain-containing protein n=1 Tax=Novipirellula rosea TaxID=1031540 RepID=UPI0031F086D2